MTTPKTLRAAGRGSAPPTDVTDAVDKDARPPIDDIDKHILGLLAGDARLSVRAIARMISMSPGAVSERIERLEARGVIQGYHAAIDATALGFGMEAFLGLQVAQGLALELTVSELYALQEVKAVHVVAGQWDLIVEMHVRDQHHLRQVLVSEIWEMTSFRHSETMLILDSRRRAASWFAVSDRTRDKPSARKTERSATKTPKN